MDRSIESRLLTAEEFYGLPDDGSKHELLAGIPIAEPRPGMRHGRIVARIVEMLSGFVRPRRLGTIFTADTGYILARGPDTVRGPDVSFLSRERFEEVGDLITACPVAPDLAVEVVSPSDRPTDIHAKVADYLAAGTRVVWVVDPQGEIADVYRALLSGRRLGKTDSLEAEEVLPGFAVLLADVFALD